MNRDETGTAVSRETDPVEVMRRVRDARDARNRTLTIAAAEAEKRAGEAEARAAAYAEKNVRLDARRKFLTREVKFLRKNGPCPTVVGDVPLTDGTFRGVTEGGTVYEFTVTGGRLA